MYARMGIKFTGFSAVPRVNVKIITAKYLLVIFPAVKGFKIVLTDNQAEFVPGVFFPKAHEGIDGVRRLRQIEFNGIDFNSVLILECQPQKVQPAVLIEKSGLLFER